jgi:hypothetical protein
MKSVHLSYHVCAVVEVFSHIIMNNEDDVSCMLANLLQMKPVLYF